MKVTFITLAHRRPDFIRMQYYAIKKYVKDIDIEYIVYNNAVDNENLKKQINDICKELKIKCIDIVLEEEYRVQKQGGCFEDNQYTTIQSAVSYPLNWAWSEICKMKGIVCLIDSDMFFIKDININEIMFEKDIAFVPQYRSSLKVLYMWNGLVFLNMETLPGVHKIDWSPGLIEGDSTDVGGHTYSYLREYMDDIKILFLEFWGLYDLKTIEDNKESFFVSMNGCICYDFIIENNILKSFEDRNPNDLMHPRFSEFKSFPHETDKENYDEYVSNQFQILHNFLVTNEIYLPDPPFIDFIKIQDTDIKDAFVVHYKSGSNWQTFYTEEYNFKKTESIKKIIQYNN